MKSSPKTLVIKVGSSTLIKIQQHAQKGHDETLIDLPAVSKIVAVLADLRRKGHRVVLVSSGAVGLGKARLGLKGQLSLREKQASAAAGQSKLMRVYDDLFELCGKFAIAQVLITRRDMAHRQSYLNAENTFLTLLEKGAIPIVNENDTVSPEEIRFGDNDSLGALVAGLVKADWLFLLTDVDYLYTSNPRTDPHATAVKYVEDVNSLNVVVSGAGSSLGTGGMATKVTAARLANASGVNVVIVNGSRPEEIGKFIEQDPDAVGTVFGARGRRKMTWKKRWIAHTLEPRGTITVDDGASRSIFRKSLFAAGIVSVDGDFNASDVVAIVDLRGTELARGTVEYSSGDLKRMAGHQSQNIESILGAIGPAEVVHRDNMARLASEKSVAGVDGETPGKLSPKTRPRASEKPQAAVLGSLSAESEIAVTPACSAAAQQSMPIDRSLKESTETTDAGAHPSEANRKQKTQGNSKSEGQSKTENDMNETAKTNGRTISD